MKKLRLFCAALALVLLFTAQPATAVAETGNTRSTTITAKCRMPSIIVTVPTTGQVYLNPLKLKVNVDGADTTEQVLSRTCFIANKGDIPLQVDVSLTAALTEGSDMTLASSSTKGSASTSKLAFIYYEMQLSDDYEPDDVQWDKTYDASKHIVLSTGETKSKENILTLAPKTLDGEMGKGGFGAFRLTGDAIENPQNAWHSKDGLMVEVAFTFTPLSYV